MFTGGQGLALSLWDLRSHVPGVSAHVRACLCVICESVHVYTGPRVVYGSGYTVVFCVCVCVHVHVCTCVCVPAQC